MTPSSKFPVNIRRRDFHPDWGEPFVISAQRHQFQQFVFHQRCHLGAGVGRLRRRHDIQDHLFRALAKLPQLRKQADTDSFDRADVAVGGVRAVGFVVTALGLELVFGSAEGEGEFASFRPGNRIIFDALE